MANLWPTSTAKLVSDPVDIIVILILSPVLKISYAPWEDSFFKDLFASIRDIVGGRSGSYEKVLREAKDTALREMKEEALKLNATAVIGVDLDYETVGKNGGMLMVTASGTAVKL